MKLARGRSVLTPMIGILSRLMVSDVIRDFVIAMLAVVNCSVDMFHAQQLKVRWISFITLWRNTEDLTAASV